MNISSFAPASKILSALVFAAVAAILPTIPSACLAFLCGLIVLCIFPPSWNSFLKRAAVINIFVLFIWFFTPWTTPGESMWEGSWFTKEGVVLSLLVTLKVNALFCIFFTLVSSMSFSQLAAGLNQLGFPDKLVAMILFCARGITIFEKEYANLTEAAKLRGFYMKTDLRTYRTVGAMVALLFSKAFRKGRILEQSMILRGFNGKIRTLTKYQWTGKDIALLGAFSIVSFCLSVSGWML